jgi:hypothetical protein
MKILIPFQGFYESVHSSMLDDAEEQMFSDDSGTCNDKLHERFYRMCDYRKAHAAYALHYAKAFAEYSEIKLKFEKLDSPREYNFTTDRIFCDISRAEVRRLRGEVMPLSLDEFAKRHTSCDGFYSFYDPDWRTWGHVDAWDHNQLETLLLAWVDQHLGEWGEQGMDLMEGYRCNGYFDTWLSDACPQEEVARLHKVALYLRDRQER